MILGTNTKHLITTRFAPILTKYYIYIYYKCLFSSLIFRKASIHQGLKETVSEFRREAAWLNMSGSISLFKLLAAQYFDLHSH